MNIESDLNEAPEAEGNTTKWNNMEMNPLVKEKMKKNLVYVSIFSVVMLFAGLTSAYIVSMGDSFWIKFPLPTSFWISTAVIALSSLFIQLGITFAKKDNQKLSKLFVVLTFVFGLLFVYFQYKGYGELVNSGSHLRGDIMVVDGRYGSIGDDGRYYGYYEIKYNGKFIEIDGNDYLVDQKKLTPTQFSELKGFTKQFEKIENTKDLAVTNYGRSFVLYYKQQPISLINGKLCLPDSSALQFVDLMRLRDLAINISAERGDFFMKGKIGKDFHVYFKGKELEYENRIWKYKGKILDDYLQTKPLESPDTSSSYLWIITFLHLAHIIFALLYMIRIVNSSLLGRFTSSDTLSLRVGAIFWHYLALLWVYLLLFLLFIH
jgi:cytochrome c oxidase subunit 3